MKNTNKILLILLITILLVSLSISAAAAQEQPIVRAILFWSPTCGHCEYVITEVIQPLYTQYGNQILILGISTASQVGSELFISTVEETGFPMEQAGVPFLVIGDQVMIGSGQIPEELPGLVAESLKGDGIAWPPFPAIQEFLLTQGFVSVDGQDITPTPMPATQATEGSAPTQAATQMAEQSNSPELAAAQTPEPTPTEQPDPEPMLVVTDDPPPDTLWETLVFRFNHDRTANTIAVGVLLFLIGVVVYIAVHFMRASVLKTWPEWVLPVLLVIGLAIAGYLASVEVSGNEAVCGPVGDCNAVQQSKYATLFGFLPVAVFGIIGYLVIGATWLIGKKSSGRLQFYAKLAMFLTALFGLLFFIYLTFLEPFVIGATCAWCITSAILMAVINLFTLPIVLEAWAELDEDDQGQAEYQKID
ncbi:MAG: hypothetical protein JW757_02375 [Anaerolineales bacterium]|nr:hypothetical protein [Anaerolineales bacterium]